VRRTAAHQSQAEGAQQQAEVARREVVPAGEREQVDDDPRTLVLGDG
jgi:hypothetical protein